MQLERYDSLSEFAAACEVTPDHGHISDSKWGGCSFSNALMLAEQGDDRIAARLESRLDAMVPARTGRVTVHVPDGGAVDVGAYLAGRPDAFMRKERRRSDRSPLQIYVNCTVGANFTATDAENRGAAILSLIQTLSETRAVELYAVIATYGNNAWYAAVVRLETRPLSVAHAAFALCHIAMLRQLGFRRAYDNGFNGSWPSDRSEKTWRQRLAIDDDALYIQEMYNHDPLALNPERWMEEQLARLNQE